MSELERETQQRRIEPMLKKAKWKIVDYKPATQYTQCAVREYPTATGKADYLLFSNSKPVAVIEAKRVSLGPQNVLTQAERYARGLTDSPFNFNNGFRVPFAYSTNGEQIWFRDLRKNDYSRKLSNFHTPDALDEMISRDTIDAELFFLNNPNTHKMLRKYQISATSSIEKAVISGKRKLLVAMATGTGKTYTIVSQIYRLIKSTLARRILFLVDRRALAAQAVTTFKSFEPEVGYKFDMLYEVYSQRLRKEELEGAKFNPKILPETYLTSPKPSHTFVYVSTIQRMRINLFGRESAFKGEAEEDAQRLDIPIHAFDVVIADECHRGYTAQEISKWREVLDYFDAITIGLTATPAAHTVAYFGEPIFRYTYEEAVNDEYLVDYDSVSVHSGVRINGAFLKEGELVGRIDTETGIEKLDNLEDERFFDASKIEQDITSPESNRKIIEEIKKYALEHEKRYHRFPKTLIFAVNDIPHISHCDQLVRICREVFGRGDDFVQKITGTVDRPLQRIREFRNRPKPAIAITVDMLTTGVDIPAIEFLVFLRPVRSRILFEQMLGRGTRLAQDIGKGHFVVFDCFGGSLLEYFKDVSSFTIDPPTKPTRTIPEIIEDIYQNKDRKYNIRVLVKRLLRIDKGMSGEARELFANFIPEGDIAKFAKALPTLLNQDFAKTMFILKNEEFQDLLINYPRPKKDFLVGYEVEDDVYSSVLFGDKVAKPQDYISSFERWIRENKDKISAIKILLDRPKDWSTDVLYELRKTLKEHKFTEERLKKAYHNELADIISIIKHAIDRQYPLLSAEDRIEYAIANITAEKRFTHEQINWLGFIKEHLIRNLAIDKKDFDLQPIFVDKGGFVVADRVFEGELEALLERINMEVAKV